MLVPAFQVSSSYEEFCRVTGLYFKEPESIELYSLLQGAAAMAKQINEKLQLEK